jgi:DNA-binding NarL/FixJ family response regulator
MNATKNPITVAIADDHQMWHDHLNISLPEFGFKILINAMDGQELLDKLQASAKLPDICLIDINMPVMDGFETTRRLKESYPQIKILAFSLEDDERTVERIKECGVDGFVWKCVSMAELRDALLKSR